MSLRSNAWSCSRWLGLKVTSGLRDCRNSSVFRIPQRYLHRTIHRSPQLNPNTVGPLPHKISTQDCTRSPLAAFTMDKDLYHDYSVIVRCAILTPTDSALSKASSIKAVTSSTTTSRASRTTLEKWPVTVEVECSILLLGSHYRASNK